MTRSKLLQLLHTILNHRWVLAISTVICIAVSWFTLHTFAAKSYCSPGILGLASGFAAIAAGWLGYSLIRWNNNNRL